MSKRSTSCLMVLAFLSLFLQGFLWSCPGEASDISVVDLAGRTVTVGQPVERVVLTFNFEEYVAVAGEKGLDKIVGWSTRYWKGRRQSTWDAFVDKFPEIDKISDVGYINKNTL